MDKSLLFKDRLPEKSIEIPGVGTIRLRGLTRSEVLKVRKATDDARMDGDRALVLERKLLAKAMINPELSEAEVGKWQESATPGELEPVIEAVQELSGLVEGAGKSDVPDDGERTGD